MSNFSLRASLKLTGFDLKNSRRQIFGWCIAIFSIMFMYMILFPSMQDMAKLKMEALPKQFLQLFDMEDFSSLNNFINYFGMVFNLILIAMSIFAATFAANIIYREEKSKTIEFLYSLEVSRTEIYVSKLITAFIASLGVMLSAVASTAICGFVNGGETFIPSDFLQIIKISGFTVFFFMAFSLMLAAITTKVGVAGVGSMVVLFCYLLGYLSKLLDTKAQWLAYLSPFQLFDPKSAIALERNTLVELGIYFILMVIFLIAGGIVYKRRDFNI